MFQKVERSEGGATLDPQTLERLKNASGFAVALPGTEVTVSASRFFSGEQFALVADYVARYVKAAGAYVGVWADGDTVYLDQSEVVADRSTAEALGRERRQKAIYHYDSGQVITL